MPSWTGLGFLFAANAVCPILGLTTGTVATAITIVSIDPGPTVLLTWGHLLLTAEKTYRLMLPIPLATALICTVTGGLIELPVDIVLISAALAALIVIVTLKRCVPLHA